MRLRRGRDPVRDEVRDVIRPHGSGEAHVSRLDGRGSEGENFVPGPLCVTVQVQRNMDPVGVDHARSVLIAERAAVQEVLRVRFGSRPVLRVVARGQGVQENFESAPVVQAPHALHEVGQGVVSEVAADVADPQAPPRKSNPGAGWRRRQGPEGASHRRCGQGVRGVSPADHEHQVARQRVGDHMEGLDTRQLPPGEGVHDNAHQRRQSRLAVVPAADELLAVEEAADSLLVVGFDREGLLERDDGLLVQPQVLLARAQVGVRPGGVRVQLHHLLVAGNGLHEFPLKLQSSTEVVVQDRELEGPFLAVSGARPLEASASPGRGGAVVQVYAPLVALLGLRHLAEAPQRVAHAVLRLHVRRVKERGPPGDL